MEDINKIELQGRVGDIISVIDNGIHTVKFSLATRRANRPAKRNTTVEFTWHNCIAQASEDIPETLLERIRREATLHLTGTVRNVRYADRIGIERFNNVVSVESIDIIKDGRE